MYITLNNYIRMIHDMPTCYKSASLAVWHAVINYLLFCRKRAVNKHPESPRKLTSSWGFILENGLSLALLSEQQTLKSRIMSAVLIKI